MYKPLDSPEIEFRLLTLLPSVEIEDDVHVVVQHTPLDRAPPYEALSYTWTRWGDCEESIYIDGVEVTVTENLYRALKTLRLSKDTRVLWNDRVCINQKDEEEKRKQLGLMRDIYEKAESVIAWPGIGRDQRWPTLVYIDLYFPPEGTERDPYRREEVGIPIYSAIHAIMCALVSDQPWPVVHHTEHRYSGYEYESQVVWKDVWSFSQFAKILEDFMAESYWQRVWVVQELAAASKVEVYVGDKVLDWNLLRDAAHAVHHHFRSCCRNLRGHDDPDTATIDDSLSKFSRIILEIEKTRQLYRSKTRLEPFLRLHRNKGATRQHDVMNALINLVRDWGAGPRMPISLYTTDFEDVVCGAIFSQISAFNSLSLLCGDVGTDDCDHEDVIGGAWDEDFNKRFLALKRPIEGHSQARTAKRDRKAMALLKVESERERKNLYGRASLPTWARCFACCGTMHDSGPIYSSPRFDNLHLYYAAWELAPQVRLQSGRVLRVIGEIVDTIKSVDSTTLKNRPGSIITEAYGYSQDNSQEFILEGWQKVIENQHVPSPAYTDRRALRLAFARALHCDIAIPDSQTSNKDEAGARRLDSEEIDFYYRLMYEPEKLGENFNISSSEVTEAAISYNVCALGRNLFVTAHGRIGLGSPAIEEGDLIVILYGGSVPFVLRRSKSLAKPRGLGPQRYQLFGDCYCDGLMDGEGVLGNTENFILE